MRFIPACILLSLISGGVFAKDIAVGFGKDKPPFVFGRDQRGLEIDIFREALASEGHGLLVEHFDNRALADAVLKGRVDAAATVQSDDPELCRVERFIQFQNVAISLAGHAPDIDSVESLGKYRVLAWEGAYQDLGDEFFTLFAPGHRTPERAYMEHYSQEAQVKMFWLGRADVLVIDKVIFEWYRTQMPPNLQSQRAVEYHSVFSSPTFYPALFLDKALCEDFRVGLEKLKGSGRYKALYKSYIE